MNTSRPTALPSGDCCPRWPLCGGDLGHCCNSTAPTTPALPADPVPALVTLALELSVKGARLRRGEAALSPTDAARYRREVAAELDRMAPSARQGGT